MMKLIVFSDNHRNEEIVKDIIHNNPNCDRYISLGDSEMSEEALTSLGVFGVRGNYPFEPKYPYELIFEFEGVKTLLTHGHKYNVKSGLYSLFSYAKTNNCKLVLYGHTHQFKIDEIDNIIMVNPGSANYPKGFQDPTFAKIELNEISISINIVNAITQKVILNYTKKR